MKKITEWKRDVIYGSALCLVAVVLFISSFSIDAGTVKLKMAQPGPYMRFWLILMAALGVVIIVRALLRKSEKEVEGAYNKISLFTVAAIAVYLLVLPYLGFTISTFIFMATTTIVFTKIASDAKGLQKSLKNIIVFCLIFSAIMTAFTWWTFSDVLTVVLPRFSLF